MVTNNKYGSHFKNIKGYKVKTGHKTYNHCFGGTGWSVVDTKKLFDGPSLILTLDLNDPCVNHLKCHGLTELPLCSYLNCSVWEDEQVFKIIPENKEVHLIDKQIKNPEEAIDEDKLPNPLPRKKIYLEDLNLHEYPLDEDTYWNACDAILGGDDFIRILQPVWMQDVETHNCSCGKQMIFTACVGYEDYEISNGFIGDIPFFLGEAVLYFFFCTDCLIVKSTCQSS
jgi:hypothetical protein